MPVLAAHRAGIRRIILPSRNEADVEDIPDDIRKELQIVFVSRINEVVDAALQMLVANPPPPIAVHAGMDSAPRQPETAPLAVRQS